MTHSEQLEAIFSEATLEECEELLDYAGLMVRLKRKWNPQPVKRGRPTGSRNKTNGVQAALPIEAGQ